VACARRHFRREGCRGVEDADFHGHGQLLIRWLQLEHSAMGSCCTTQLWSSFASPYLEARALVRDICRIIRIVRAAGEQGGCFRRRHRPSIMKFGLHRYIHALPSVASQQQPSSRRALFLLVLPYISRIPDRTQLFRLHVDHGAWGDALMP